MPPLRFLADESCDFAVVRALRAANYDVLAVSEVMNRSVDRDLIERAYHEERIVLTEDKDFGWLVFVSHVESAGVILIRFPSSARRALPQAVLTLVREKSPQLIGAFVVLEPRKVRFSQRPASR